MRVRKYFDSMHALLNDHQGYITAAQVTAAGIPRRYLSEMLASGEICKVTRGLYALPAIWEDEMYSLQYRFAKGVFSHGTALYLHAMTDRTPHRYTMTFPHGYNTSGAKKQGLVVKTATSERFGLGITEVSSPCGKLVKVYDIERTLCDIVRGRHIDDVQLVNQAMKTYAVSGTKDIPKLMLYAERLCVKPKVLRYMEVLL